MQLQSNIPPYHCECPACGHVFVPSIYAEEIATFWTKVDIKGPDQCWPWKRSLDAWGYGQLYFAGKMRKAHRLAYELTNGALPPGRLACHSCDERVPAGDISYRKCCNPNHLWPGTDAENKADAQRKGRLATGNRNGARAQQHRIQRGDQHWSHRTPGKVARGERQGARTHPEQIKRGAELPQAKLTRELVERIRADHDQGASYAAIARNLGLPYQRVYDAGTGRRWRHIH